MENRRCLLLSSCTGDETDRSPDSSAPSAEVLLIDDGLAAVDGDKNSDADGLRGICSLALPSCRVGVLEASGDRKLCRRKSASLVCPRRRSKPCIIGMVGLRVRTHLWLGQHWMERAAMRFSWYTRRIRSRPVCCGGRVRVRV